MKPRFLVPAFLVLAALVWLATRVPQGSPVNAVPPAAVAAAPAVERSAVVAPPAPSAEPESRHLAIAARQVIAAGWAVATVPEFVAFRDWTERYLHAAAADRAALVPAGRQLAAQRLAKLAELIRRDPQAALEAAVPMVVRQQLPAEILAQLETRVSGIGELALQAVTPAPGVAVPEPMFRSTLLNGQEYRAYVYGRRAQQATVQNTSMVGIAVGRSLAVSESPIRLVEAGEIIDTPPARQCICTLQNNAGSSGTVAAEYGGKIRVLCSPPHVSKLESSLLSDERSARNLVLADGAPGSSTVVNRPDPAWTHGTKRVLIIRVDFSDKAGTPIYGLSGSSLTDDFIVNVFNGTNGIADYYTQASWGKTALQVTATTAGDSPDVTAVFRMPQTAAAYATGGLNSQLHTDARAAATAAGVDVASYDRVGVVFGYLGNIASSQITYGGLGDVEGTKFWINGYFDFRVVAHEIGHNYGLNHANLWQVTDGNPVSATGTSTEYGDPFDIMGINGSIDLHFSHLGKNMLSWIPDTAVTTISAPGTYRVYRFDAAGADLNNARALKIVRDSQRDYWIGYRRATTNASLDGGAYVLWGYNTNQQSNLLDMTTPGTNVNDAGLAIGTTFNDATRGITIRPTAQGGTGAEEYLDVEVTLTPMITLETTAATIGENDGSVALTVTRSRSSTGSVSVSYTTASGTATSGSDFTATSGTLSWADGDLTPRTITVPITADAVAETTENFTVSISSPVGGILGDTTQGTITIVDPGVRDPDFAANFINNTVDRIAVRADGSVILTGDFTQIQTADFTVYNRGRITQIDSTGALDPTFAANGDVNSGANGSIRDMAVQPDGKIIIVGAFSTVHGVARANIARLNADGTLDTSFDPGAGADNTVNAVLLQPDGKIVIGGRFLLVGNSLREYLARLNADGSVDTTFVGPDFAATSGWRVEALAMQADGKILVGGSFYFTGANFKAGLCRVSSTGALDATFSGVVAGAHALGNTGSLLSVNALMVQPDGKIWIGGAFTAYNTVARSGLARLNSDGSLDTSIDPSIANSGGSIGINVITYLPNGSVLVGGTFTSIAGTTAANQALITSAGAVDAVFAAKGGPGGAVRDFALLPDGRIYLGTFFTTFQSAPSSRPLFRMYGPLAGAPGTVSLVATTSSANEGANATLTVARTGAGIGPLTIGYSTVAGTATTADYTTAAGVLVWSDGDLTTRTISVPLTSDAVVDAGETFTVQLGQPLVGGSILGANRLATVTVNELSGYAAFTAAQFTTLEQANAAISGPNADPDNDGYANLIEYALGLNPKSANTGAITSVAAAGGEWVYTYARPANLTDVTYAVQFSTNLTTWTTAGVTHEFVSTAGGIETWRARVTTTGNANAFFRLSVTR